ncbi:Conserved_hypothetical protein [Hexamita inflata]|uniref:Transmembrane protein n=1 Tax=Hexamita inflata TaxID=28002 RepID=A0AA86TJZ7_9EUKA|nr:Conserved hypothetical protein [Hexamita inflata]
MTAQSSPLNVLTDQAAGPLYDQQAIISSITFGNIAVFATKQQIIGLSYNSNNAQPLGENVFKINTSGNQQFVSMSKRDQGSFFVLMFSDNKFLYNIYSINGNLMSQTQQTRDIVYAQAIEGTPFIACAHKPGNAMAKPTFSFDMILDGNQPVSKSVRIAKAHGDVQDFIDSVFYQCIRLPSKPQLSSKNPVTTQQQFESMLLQSMDQNQLFMLSAIHLTSNRTQVIYREYIFKTRGRYEVHAEITKNLPINILAKVSRIVPFSCNAASNSLLFNAFGVITEAGEMQVYNYTKLNLQIEQRVKLFNGISGGNTVNFTNSYIVCSSLDEIEILGVDQQFNDPNQIIKLRTQLINGLAPLISQIQNQTIEVAKSTLAYQIVPQPPQWNANRALNLLLKQQIPFQISQILVDTKSLFICGPSGQIFVYSIEKLRNQLVYEFYASKAGDCIAALIQQFPDYQENFLQVQQSIMSSQPQQAQHLSQSGQNLFSPLPPQIARPVSQLNRNRSSPTAQPLQRASSASKDGLKIQQEEPDEMSILRNSGMDDIAGIDVGATLNLQNTQNLIEIGNQIIQKEDQNEEANSLKQENQLIQLELMNKSELLEKNQNELVRLWLKTIKSELPKLTFPAFKNQDEVIMHFEAYREQLVDQNSALYAIHQALDQDVSYTMARFCQFDPSELKTASLDPIDQTFYSKTQIYKLFQVQFNHFYLLNCGHEVKFESNKILFDLSDEQNVYDSLIQSFQQQFVVPEALYCRNCRIDQTDKYQEEFYQIIIPQKLLIRSTRPVQTLSFDLNGSNYTFTLQGIFSNNYTQIFYVDFDGQWIDLDGNKVSFEMIQRAINEPIFQIYTQAKSQSILVEQQAMNAVLQIVSENSSQENMMEVQKQALQMRQQLREQNTVYDELEKVQKLNAQLLKDNQEKAQLEMELKQYQLHDKQSQKALDDQKHIISQYELELDKYQKNWRQDFIADQSHADLLKHQQQTKLEFEQCKQQLNSTQQELQNQMHQVEQLQAQLKYTVSQQQQEEVAKRCLEHLGAKQIPKYPEEIFKQLEVHCLAVQAEKQVLKSMIGDNSMLKSQEVVSNYKSKKCSEYLLPGIVVGFGVILIALFALVLQDGGMM